MTSPALSWLHPQWFGSFTSIINQENDHRPAHRPIWGGHFLQSDLVLLNWDKINSTTVRLKRLWESVRTSSSQVLLLLIGSSLETRGYDAGEDQKLLERKEKNMQEKSKGYHVLWASAFAFSQVTWGRSSLLQELFLWPESGCFSLLWDDTYTCFHFMVSQKTGSSEYFSEQVKETSCIDSMWRRSLKLQSLLLPSWAGTSED